MKLTIQNTMNDKIFSIEVDETSTVEDVKVLIEVETQILI